MVQWLERWSYIPLTWVRFLLFPLMFKKVVPNRPTKVSGRSSVIPYSLAREYWWTNEYENAVQGVKYKCRMVEDGTTL